MKKIICKTNAQIIDALRYIEELPLSPVHEIIIREYREDRSLAQNSLYWGVWLVYYSKHLGTTKDELHQQCKERHLVPIFIRDNPDYAEMVEAVKNVRRAGMNREADAMKKEIVRLTSTTDCNVAQMSEYLTEIEREAGSTGCSFPHPDDTYYFAMGMKR